MDINKKLESNYDINDEIDYMGKVAEDFGLYGKTSLLCPRCGGKFIYEQYGSSYTIRCERDGCIKEVSRGI